MSNRKMFKMQIMFEDFVDRTEIIKALNSLKFDEIHITEIAAGHQYNLFGEESELNSFANKIQVLYPSFRKMFLEF